MKIYFVALIALVTVIFTACNSNKKNNETSTEVIDENVLTPLDSNTKEANGAPTVLLNNVYDSYFALIEALANDDGKAAQAAAKNLHKAIADAPKDKMTAEQQGVWELYQRKLSYDADHIMGINETPHQREHLVSLSKNLFEVMKEVKPSKKVYYQNCPMYNSNKGGTWLSENVQIKNPYYGESMLDCGTTIDSIKN